MTADRSGSSSDPISDFFLDNPEKLNDPFADLAWLREHRPVHKHEASGQWFVFPYDEVRSLFADKRMSADRIAGFAEAVPASMRGEVQQIVPYLETWLIFRDGTGHSHLRSVLHRGFHAKAIEAMRRPIENVANRLLTTRLTRAASTSPRTSVSCSPCTCSGLHGRPPRGPRQGAAVVGRLRGLLQHHSHHRGHDPADDPKRKRDVRAHAGAARGTRNRSARRLPGTDVAAARAGDISEEEVVGSTLLLLIAGHLPVRNLIGNAVWLLQQNPSEYERFLADPTLLHSLIEESLRYEPPVAAIPRIPMEDIVVCDQKIAAGEIIQLSICSANRDPSHFPDPDRFDVGREASRRAELRARTPRLPWRQARSRAGDDRAGDPVPPSGRPDAPMTVARSSGTGTPGIVARRSCRSGSRDAVRSLTGTSDGSGAGGQVPPIRVRGRAASVDRRQLLISSADRRGYRISPCGRWFGAAENRSLRGRQPIGESTR